MWASTNAGRPRAWRRRATPPASTEKQTHDQEHGIGTEEARLEEVALVEQKIFAQHRQRARVSCRIEIARRAPEEFFVGEHRQRGGARLFVRARNLGRIGVVRDRCLPTASAA